jgi:hypothetical protein
MEESLDNSSLERGTENTNVPTELESFLPTQDQRHEMDTSSIPEIRGQDGSVLSASTHHLIIKDLAYFS